MGKFVSADLSPGGTGYYPYCSFKSIYGNDMLFLSGFTVYPVLIPPSVAIAPNPVILPPTRVTVALSFNISLLYSTSKVITLLLVLLWLEGITDEDENFITVDNVMKLCSPPQFILLLQFAPSTVKVNDVGLFLSRLKIISLLLLP